MLVQKAAVILNEVKDLMYPPNVKYDLLEKISVSGY